jgi:DNA N-6-adenine-methyltransferase (Dam)
MKLANRNIDRKWYVPAKYVQLASAAMAGIDHRADNAEGQWFGRIWIDPPCHRAMSDLVDKLIAELDAGSVSEAIMLAPNSTDTKWFHRVAPRAKALCFPRGRIKFLAANGRPRAGNIQGQCFLYFGVDDTQFRRYFSKLGFIRPKRQPDVSQATY